MSFINTRDAEPSGLPDVVLGTLTCPDGVIYQTLERDPIPLGVYQLVPHTVVNGPLHGLQTYSLVNYTLGVYEEPGPGVQRFAVLFHPGNFPSDSEGCILVGMNRNTLPNPPNLGLSRVAFDAIIQKIRASSDFQWVIQ